MKHLSDYNFFDPDLLVCPYEFYKLAREQDPILELPSPQANTQFFLVTCYDLVVEILKDPRVFSSNFLDLLAGKAEPDEQLKAIADRGYPQKNTLLTADPPEHDRFRSLVNKAFTSSRIDKMQDSILDTAELLSIIQQILVAGNETVTSALASGMLLLIQNPQQMKVLQADLSQLNRFVEEVLRMETPKIGDRF
jgi:cytochrome P450